MSFQNINLTNLNVTKDVENINYSQISDLSSFPISIDNLKTIDFSSTSLAQIGTSLKRYYQLLILYLNNDASFINYLDEFKSLTTKISQYTLSSSDYIILRDSLIEIENYLKQVTDTQLYSATGVYTSLQTSARNFTTELNNIINSINTEYSKLADSGVGRIIPDGVIGKTYLDENLVNDFNFIEISNGIYIDRSDSAEVILPDGLVKKPIVFKVVK